MIQFRRLLLVLLLLFALPFASRAITVTDTALASNVQVCLKKELVRLQFSVGGTGTTGSYLDIKLPSGFTFEGIAYGPLVSGGSGSNTATYAGIVGGKHRITFSGSTAFQTIRIGFWQKASCGAGTSSFTARDSLFFYEGTGSINVSTTNQFNGTAPSLSITSISNTPAIAGVGATVTRKYKVSNGGFGATSHFVIVDDYLNGGLAISTSSFKIDPSGVNYSIPVSAITDNSDSVIIVFSPSLIQQIGDGDTLFENGESFELQYLGVTNNCGDNSNNILSSLHSTWLCNGSACTYSNAATAISVSVPAAPNFYVIAKPVQTYCTAPSYISVDTFIMINTGGMAKDVDILVASRYWTGNPNAGATDYSGWLDTANFFIKIGKNGTKIHPLITLTATNSLIKDGCSWLNRPAQFKIRIPFFNNTDTLYGFIAQQYCTMNKTCGAEKTHSEFGPGYPGTMLQFIYKNACGNITYPVVGADVRGSECTQIFWTNKTADDFFCGVAGELVLKNQGTQSQIPGGLRSLRSYFNYEINLPPALVMDAAYTSIQQVRYVWRDGSIHYPYFQPATNVWRFKMEDIVGDNAGSFVVKVKGASSGSGICSGVNTYNQKLSLLYDSTICAPSGNEQVLMCTSTPFNYYGCIVCCPSGGLSLLRASFMRVNFGKPDNDDNRIADGTGNVDTTKIERQYAVNGDTMRLYIKTLVVTNATHPKWQNAYLGGILPGGISSSRWTYLKGGVLVKRPASTDTVINLTSYSILSGDSIRFDISSISDLVNGDTVILNAYFKENLDINGSASFNVVPFYYASHTANPTTAQRFACGNAIISFTHFRVIGEISNIGNYVFSSCNRLVFETRLYNSVSDNQNWYPNVFKYEFRDLLYPTRVAVRIPKGYVIDSVNLNLDMGEGVNNGASKFRWTVPYTINNDSIIIDYASLMTPNGGSIRVPDEGSYSTIRYYVQPTCKVVPGVLEYTSSTYKLKYIPNNTLRDGFLSGFGTFSYNAPVFLLNSSQPVYNGYSKVANWPLTITNTSTLYTPNVWMRLRSKSGNLPIDSVKLSGTLLPADANGFYRLGAFNGNQANNLTIYSKNLACSYDSLQVFIGYGCKGYPASFSDTTCTFTPKSLYIQPQPAAIQTQVSLLASTPVDPSNGSSSAYGSSTIYMCQSFPFEMEIQSTQPGTIYNVKEVITLPFNGGAGLNYVSDSGYIEYPIGSTPRKFSVAANSSLISQSATGSMTMDLAQIDPTNFSSNNGLPGTGLGTNATRRVILRWKMKSNCNLVSGDQWQPTQQAVSPCSQPAAGNNNVTSGFALNLTGVSKPYVATLNVKTGLDGCGTQNTQLRIEKTGGSTPAPTDSIVIRLPVTVAPGTMTCLGTYCPGGNGSTQAYSLRADAFFKYISFPYPVSAGANGDTLLYSFPMRSVNKATCETNQTVKADVYQQLTIYCGSPTPANLCPNSKNSLGSNTKTFDIRKPVLSFTGYSSSYVYPSRYKYKFSGNVSNTSSAVAASSGVTLKTFMDVNNNLVYEKGIDALVKTTVLSSIINTNSSVFFSDSFVNSAYSPSPSLPMYTVIDTGDAPANCFCGGIVQSAFNQALPLEFLSVSATNLNNLNSKIEWSTNADANTLYFNLYRRAENNPVFVKVGTIRAQNIIGGISKYTYYDPIYNLSNGKIYYQIEGITGINTSKQSKVVSITKTSNTPNSGFYTLSSNPAGNEVKVILTEGIEEAKITLCDASGKIVYQKNSTGDVNTLNISMLSSGMYTVTVEYGAMRETQKLSIIK